MIKVGILGGIACGKSTITEYMHQLGACVLFGDAIAHRVLEYPEIVDQMEARWLPKYPHYRPIKDITGKVVRKNVAQIAFGNPEELRFLEAITWPLILKELQTR